MLITNWNLFPDRGFITDFAVNVTYADSVSILIIIPYVNFQQSDWSNCRLTILNVTRQCHTACVSDHTILKFVVEMGHSV